MKSDLFLFIYQQEDSVQLTGTISGPEGRFSLENISPGTYMVEVFFLGYENRFFRDITVEASSRGADLGRISLSPTVIASEAVEVEGRKPAVSYQIDKKVISVDEKLTAVSGNAADVLENVPSVTVDIDGNVSLRGSSNFRVLIDGRPSVLDASDALQQIPASSIENIEIITNPFSRESFNWNLRFNNSFRLGKDLQAQINTRYNSPTVSSQGRREGFFSADLALKQTLFAQFMTATLQVRDIFGTEKYERFSRGLDFYNYNLSDRESPSVMLNLRFNINNYKQPREGGNRGGGRMMIFNDWKSF